MAVIIVSLGLAAVLGYTLATTVEPPAAPMETPSDTDRTQQPDAKLMQFRQTKMSELDQLNAELAPLQSKIAVKQSEYDELKELVDVACDRISRILGRPTNLANSPEGFTLATNDELITHSKMANVSQELTRLQEQEQPLLFNKQYLEQDINEVMHYTSQQYYQFKLSQLEKLEAKLVTMQLDWEQKVIVGGGSLEHSSKHPAGYKMCLLERHLLQQDIEQLEKLLQGH